MTDQATLELSRRFDGYMVQLDEVIVRLRDAGLITTKYVGDGYVIARAVPAPLARPVRMINGKWARRHPIGAFPREAKRSAV